MNEIAKLDQYCAARTKKGPRIVAKTLKRAMQND